MHFEWSPEDNGFFQHTIEFAQKHLNEDLPSRLEEGRFSRDLWRACGEFGLLGLCIPGEYGGLQLSCLQTAHIMEAFGYGCRDHGLVFAASAHLFACLTSIEAWADTSLKCDYLPRLCDGTYVAAHAMTESGAGSDAGSLKTRATLEGEDYIIDGSKLYVSNATDADVFIVYANAQPKWGYMGITAFLIERNTPGVNIGNPFSKPGLLTVSLAPVHFDGCRIPATNQIGEVGAGMEIFGHSMRWERTCLLAGFLGATRRTLENCVEFARTRRQSRRPIGKFQAISHRIAGLTVQFNAAQLLLYKACWTIDQQRDSTQAVAMAKLAISENAIATGLAAMQIYGGQGYINETGVIQFLLDALPSTIFSGTSEIQYDLIAAKLGL